MSRNLTASAYVHCPFCFSREFEFEPGQEFHDGDFIICSICGKECDYTDMVNVTKENAIEIEDEYMTNELNNMCNKPGSKLN